MASNDTIICHVCGFKNAGDAERCVSCGARIDEIGVSLSDEERARRSGTQSGFDFRWGVISFVVYIALQAIALIALPMAIDAYDPQGFDALLVSFIVWFTGGTIVGWLSPGKTFLEPAFGALLALVPTIYWIIQTTPGAPPELELGFQLSPLSYMIGGLIGVMLSLFGAFLGEKIQDSTRGRRARA